MGSRSPLGAAARRFELVARLAETWVRRPSTPTRAIIDVTRRCTLRCSMCKTWQRDAHDELSAAQWGEVFRGLPRLCWLDLTGGEPFARRDFPEIVDAALDELGALRVLHFQTNGWASERVIALARRARQRRSDVDLIVTVSIDGDAAIHDQIRGRSGSHARALETLRGLQALADSDPGSSVHVGTTVTAANALSYASLGDTLVGAVPGFRRAHWHWNFGQRSAHFFGNAAAPGVEPNTSGAEQSHAIAQHIRQRGLPRDLVQLMETIYLVNLRAVRSGEPSNIPCQALRSTLFIAPEGDVYPCHIWDRPLGNLRRESIDAIWRSRRVADARRGVERLECGGCFSACEAYPALAGAPVATAVNTLRRAASLLRG